VSLDVNTNCFLLEASSLAATQLSCQRFLTKNNYLASGQLQIPWLNTEHAKKELSILYCKKTGIQFKWIVGSSQLLVTSKRN